MEKAAAWLVIYSGIISLNEHPKNRETRRTPTECAWLADHYYREYERRLKCPGSQAEQQF